jgi:hypothetical protein
MTTVLLRSRRLAVHDDQHKVSSGGTELHAEASLIQCDLLRAGADVVVDQ